MDEADPDGRHAALAAASRRRLLQVLRAAGEPMSAGQLAAAVGLHVTRARSQLEVLHRAGLVRRATDRTGRPGRPRQLYSAVFVGEPGAGHRRLAGVLAAGLAGDDDGGRQRAELTGERWAQQEMPVAHGLAEVESTRRVHQLFARLGFDPSLAGEGPARRLELHACPFRDTAAAFPQVVCSVHLGLLRGSVRRLGGPSTTVGLRPFVAPELCIVDLPTLSTREDETSPDTP